MVVCWRGAADALEPDPVEAVLADGEWEGDAGPAFGAEGAGGVSDGE